MAGGLQSVTQQLASYGRGPDKMLAHISPDEAALVDYLQGGRRTNPVTGLPEYGLFGKILKGIARAAGAVAGFAIAGPAGAAVGGGLATKMTGGSWKNALTTGALSGLGGWAGQALGGGGSGLTGALGDGGLATLSAAAPSSLTPAAMQAITQGGLGAIAPTIGALTPAALGAAALSAGGIGAALPAALVKDTSYDNSPPPWFPQNGQPGSSMRIPNYGLQITDIAPQGDLSTYGLQGGGLPSHQFTRFDWTKPPEEAVVNPADMDLARGGAVRRYAEGGKVAPTYEGLPLLDKRERYETLDSFDAMIADVEAQIRKTANPFAVQKLLNKLHDIQWAKQEYTEQPFYNPDDQGMVSYSRKYGGVGRFGVGREDEPMPMSEPQRLTNYKRGGRVHLKKSAARRASKAALAGRIKGPGTEISDSIPAYLSNNEHVIDAETIRLLGRGDPDKGHAKIETLKKSVRKAAGIPAPYKSAAERAQKRAGVR